MKACSLCTAPPPIQVLTAAPDEAVLPQGVRTEVVLIIAGMLNRPVASYDAHEGVSFNSS